MQQTNDETKYEALNVEELEQEYISLKDDSIVQKEVLLRKWCKKLYEEGQHEQALAKAKEYVYSMLKQRFIYNQTRTFFAFKPCSEYMLEELTTGSVSLSPADRFNDPIDPIITVWIKNFLATNTNDHVTFICLLQKVIEQMRIKCFVRTSPLLIDNQLNPNDTQDIREISPLMWAHYANGHRGVCMGYEIPPMALKDDGKSSFISLVPVKYEEKIELKEDKLDINMALSAKSDDWKYENEVRMILFDPNMKEEFPTIEGLRLKAVYLGVNCSDIDERKIRLALINKPVELYRMQINPKNLNRFEPKRIG